MSDFGDLINIEEFDKRDNFTKDRGNVTFYCKDCKKIVDAERLDIRGYIFVCPKCKGKNIVIGTEEGIKTNYKIKEKI